MAWATLFIAGIFETGWAIGLNTRMGLLARGQLLCSSSLESLD